MPARLNRQVAIARAKIGCDLASPARSSTVSTGRSGVPRPMMTAKAPSVIKA